MHLDKSTAGYKTKQKSFEARYRNKKNVHKRTNGWIAFKKKKKQLQGLEEELKVNVHLDSLKATLKKVTNSKTPIHDCIDTFWF